MHGFELIREQEIPELNSVAKIFSHPKSGAQLIAIQNDDENKVFGINFRTLPEDSTGVAHILEHCVLAGSRKYPVKEPFLELIKSSMQTFVNAMTFSDKTVYPVASTNDQDFFNLADVYMDAVFFPLLDRRTFYQEGWHYELEDEDGDLGYRGVVFNEMKGAYSSPDSLISDLVEESIFPDNLYRHDSGGNPENIPDLTYEQFVEFHETYYHPSNSLIWVYGDADLDASLGLANSFLSQFDAPEEPADTEIALQPRFDEPREFTRGYSVSPEDIDTAKSYVRVNWLLTEQKDVTENLAFRILSRILVSTPASPLRKALIESGLGEDLSGGGVSGYNREMIFTTGLKGVKAENVDKIEALVLDTLQQIVDEGIDSNTIEAAVNTTEFRLRENNTGGFPRGLALMFGAVTSWQYGYDPIKPLMFEEPLANVKQAIEDNDTFFEDMIQKWLLDNRHRTTTILEPDATLTEITQAKEAQRLKEAQSSLSSDELQQIITETVELKQWQETPDDPNELAKIPRLRLEDLDEENSPIPIDIHKVDETQVLYHDLFTNGIVYLDLAFDMHTVSDELLPYLGLFGRALLEMGTEEETFVQLSQRIGRETGGVYPTTIVSSKRTDDEETAWFVVRGKATMDKSDELLSVIQDILLTADFSDQARFQQIVLEEKASLESSIIPSGHMVAYGRLKSHFDKASWVSEQIGGLDYLFFIRQLAEDIQDNWDDVVAKLKAVRDTLINRSTLVCNITLDNENFDEFKPQLEAFLNNLPSNDVVIHDWQVSEMPENEGLTIPAQVNYVAKGAKVSDYGFEPHGSASVVTKFLNFTHLWEKLRVMGGAYGAFNNYDPASGVFMFASYRDPNLLETIEAYDNAADFLENVPLDNNALTGAIIGAISSMDQYQLPDAKGYTSMQRYMINYTDEMRQKHRNEVLGTSVEDFRRLGSVLRHVADNGHTVVLGSEQKINDANDQKGDDWLDTTKVL